MPNPGTTGEAGRLVLTKIGVTRRTTPDPAAVDDVPEAGPWRKPIIVVVPTAARRARGSQERDRARVGEARLLGGARADREAALGWVMPKSRADAPIAAP
jgi:hypothetical protein